MAQQHDPLHQFEVHSIFSMPSVGGQNLDFTNASLFMVIAVVVGYLFLRLGMARPQMVPGRFQSLTEMTHEFIENTMQETIGEHGRPFMPLIFTLFMFILMANMLGMVPYSFTVTSHIIVTFAMAIVLFLGINLIGLSRHGFHFFTLFAPAGVPKILLPLIVVIELFAYLMRPVSLSIRLAANMMAGHILLKVMAGFIIVLGIYFGWVPLLMSILITGFEIGIAFLQAYIFTILACIYLNDAINLH